MFKLDYVCINCAHCDVLEGAAPCVNCVPHSEGWSGFEAKEKTGRTLADVRRDLVRNEQQRATLVYELTTLSGERE